MSQSSNPIFPAEKSYQEALEAVNKHVATAVAEYREGMQVVSEIRDAGHEIDINDTQPPFNLSYVHVSSEQQGLNTTEVTILTPSIFWTEPEYPIPMETSEKGCLDPGLRVEYVFHTDIGEGSDDSPSNKPSQTSYQAIIGMLSAFALRGNFDACKVASYLDEMKWRDLQHKSGDSESKDPLTEDGFVFDSVPTPVFILPTCSHDDMARILQFAQKNHLNIEFRDNEALIDRESDQVHFSVNPNSDDEDLGVQSQCIDVHRDEDTQLTSVSIQRSGEDQSPPHLLTDESIQDGHNKGDLYIPLYLVKWLDHLERWNGVNPDFRECVFIHSIRAVFLAQSLVDDVSTETLMFLTLLHHDAIEINLFGDVAVASDLQKTIKALEEKFGSLIYSRLEGLNHIPGAQMQFLNNIFESAKVLSHSENPLLAAFCNFIDKMVGALYYQYNVSSSALRPESDAARLAMEYKESRTFADLIERIDNLPGLDLAQLGDNLLAATVENFGLAPNVLDSWLRTVVYSESIYRYELGPTLEYLHIANRTEHLSIRDLGRRHTEIGNSNFLSWEDVRNLLVELGVDKASAFEFQARSKRFMLAMNDFIDQFILSSNGSVESVYILLLQISTRFLRPVKDDSLQIIFELFRGMRETALDDFVDKYDSKARRILGTTFVDNTLASLSQDDAQTLNRIVISINRLIKSLESASAESYSYVGLLLEYLEDEKEKISQYNMKG